MITPKMIENAKKNLVEWWGEDGEAVIAECAKFPSLDMTANEFLGHCSSCGGNWSGMLLTGIAELRRPVWDSIPEDMGLHAFTAIGNVLILCGVDTSD